MWDPTRYRPRGKNLDAPGITASALTGGSRSGSARALSYGVRRGYFCFFSFCVIYFALSFVSEKDTHVHIIKLNKDEEILIVEDNGVKLGQYI